MMRLRRTKRRERRLGIEIVELALALPVMVVIVFGTLETCELLFTKQSLALAAYEAGRVAARDGSSAGAAQTRFEQITTARRITGATFTMTPADLSGAETGDEIRIDVTAPVTSNNTTNLVIVGVPAITESVVVLRE